MYKRAQAHPCEIKFMYLVSVVREVTKHFKNMLHQALGHMIFRLQCIPRGENRGQQLLSALSGIFIKHWLSYMLF